uniref:Uncharacterized protein n=1 Tax=Phlebotomus papatasi TaxID=29031 RepID=A0A1B0CYX4_PHLPP
MAFDSVPSHNQDYFITLHLALGLNERAHAAPFDPFTWHSGAEYSTQDCRELGFIKSQLMCSSCDNLDFALQELK